MNENLLIELFEMIYFMIQGFNYNVDWMEDILRSYVAPKMFLISERFETYETYI